MKKLTSVLLCALALLALPAARAGTVLVAAASDLAYCIDALGAAFGKQVPGARVKVSLGSSGNIFAQVRRGAPFEVFMSADMAYPARLAAEGGADAATLIPYAVGRIALWSPDARFGHGSGLRVLLDARVKRIAIANPDVAPYGRAAREALRAQGLWDAVQAKLVVGENIAQTAQFVESGNAQFGILSMSTLSGSRLKGTGSHYLIPDAGLAPIEQGAIVTTRGKANPLAARFVRFLRSPAARAILLGNGFALPAPAPAHG
ncbi:molybdate ABC transporter substrate-binding protein [Massilia glaciei]|uniref:Molybdate ABC transporter substrate-binding protein n=1 Tax=Massilia glaciei TaxID=1524097 RepID=A0A2U2HDS7_9BURK|nr:molybdate ABC transporter substrate-binding protein [Massilia glaciei]PWF41223.1 molybdate ABC transporter substrate-binding protein [Massilia glaciei]